MIEANESVIRWNKSPTQYYRPIFEALLTFQYCLSDIEHSNPIGLRLSPFRKILKKDWELFTKLMPHICFDIFNTSKRLPERLKDTVGGFKPTFDKIKELEVKYFSSDFPD